MTHPSHSNPTWMSLPQSLLPSWSWCTHLSLLSSSCFFGWHLMKLREVVPNADPSWSYALHAPDMAASTPHRSIFRSYLRNREYIKQNLATLWKSSLMAAVTRCSRPQGRYRRIRLHSRLWPDANARVAKRDQPAAVRKATRQTYKHDFQEPLKPPQIIQQPPRSRS